MEANGLKLNDYKTEFMVIESSDTQSKLGTDANSIRVGNDMDGSMNSARNIVASLDSKLDLVEHVLLQTSLLLKKEQKETF